MDDDDDFWATLDVDAIVQQEQQRATGQPPQMVSDIFPQLTPILLLRGLAAAFRGRNDSA
jgi:hypothetical protein